MLVALSCRLSEAEGPTRALPDNYGAFHSAHAIHALKGSELDAAASGAVAGGNVYMVRFLKPWTMK